MAKLTAGAIASISSGNQPLPITLQVLGVRKFPTGDRCRLMLSDGQSSSGFAILASQLTNLVETGVIATHCVVNITRYYCNDVTAEKKMMIILDLKVVMSPEEAGGKIGDPQQYDPKKNKVAANSVSSSNGSAARAPAAAAHVTRNDPNMARSEPAVAPQGMPNVRPISSLTPYQNKWTICARVTSKTPIKTWSNSRGEGKLFSMDLLDESGEIRATAFNAECDKFHEMIEANNVYFITVATLKTANKQYSNLKNDYEMTFNPGTQMVACHDDSGIPSMQFDFVALDQLEKAAKDTIVDIVGVCQSTAEVTAVTMKSNGRELKKRDIIVVDHTSRSISVTLWGEQAEKFVGANYPVLAIKGAKVSDFSGVSLSLLSSSTMQINPDMPEAHQVKGWWDSTGSQLSDITSLTTSRGAGGGMGANAVYKTFEEVKREGLGSQAQADYYTCKAVVALVRKENILYMACPSEGCNKKVNDMNNGMFRCEKCNREFDSYKWRMMVSCNIADPTTNQWVSMFQENGETLLSTTSDELGKMRDSDPDQFQQVLSAAAFKEFTFRLRVKMETYNDESRLKTTVMSLAPLNPVEYNKRLIKEINEMSAAA